MPRRTWQSGPAGGTPLSAVTLNEMEADIAKGADLADDLDPRISALVNNSTDMPKTRQAIMAMLQRDAEIQQQDYAKELIFSFANDVQTLRTFVVENGNTLVDIPQAQRYAGHDSGTYGIRDPSVKRYNGRYIMASTKAIKSNYLGTSTEFQLAYSEDLITWNHLALIPAGVSPATRVWAPDLFVDLDGRMYVYYSVSPDHLGSFQTYVRRCENTAGTVWSAPVQILGVPTPKAIDATIDRYGDKYVMFVKDESGKQICRAWATSPLGPFSMDKVGTWLGTGPEVEGPDLIRLPDGRYRLYYDHYEPMPGRLSFKESSDLNTWTAEQGLVYPAGETVLRHVSSLWLSQGEWNALKFQISATTQAGVRKSVTATRATSLSAPSDTLTFVPFTAVRGPQAAENTMWLSANATRLTAPTAGWYDLDVFAAWTQNGTGVRSMGYRIGGVAPNDFRVSQPGNPVGGTEQNFTASNLQLATGQYLEVFVFQTSGAALNLLQCQATLTKTANL